MSEQPPGGEANLEGAEPEPQTDVGGMARDLVEEERAPRGSSEEGAGLEPEGRSRG